MEKKLYLCEIKTIYYALAENPLEATRYVSDHLDDQSGAIKATKVTEMEKSSDVVYDDGWDDSCLVYGAEGDVTLGDAVVNLDALSLDLDQLESDMKHANYVDASIVKALIHQNKALRKKFLQGASK
jgi:hypothetical protein